jgi:hypothetical protein
MTQLIEYIEKIVCEGEGVENPASLHTSSREKLLTGTRQIIMALACRAGVSEEKSGGYFGRDHATAHHAKEKIYDLCGIYKDFKKKIEMYEEALNPAIPGTKEGLLTLIAIAETKVKEAQEATLKVQMAIEYLKSRLDEKA